MKPVAPWPKIKVTESPAFEHTTLDYFGPLCIKQNKQTEKGLGMHDVRAVNLELVEDPTSEQHLFALRRFVARQGI